LNKKIPWLYLSFILKFFFDLWKLNEYFSSSFKVDENFIFDILYLKNIKQFQRNISMPKVKTWAFIFFLFFKEFQSLKYFSELSEKTIFYLFNLEKRICERNNNRKQNFKIFIQQRMKNSNNFLLFIKLIIWSYQLLFRKESSTLI
jgi:hypothetical protein